MSWIHRGMRIGLLMLGAAALLNWESHHREVSTADGLRCVLQARSIERGAFAEGLIESIDHPLHPLAVAAVHKLIRGGDWPYAWQTSAQATSVLMLVLALAPIYLLGRELFDETSAWLGCLLIFANPVVGSIAVNVLSESTFLLFWGWGLWGAIRFLREGRFTWLPPTIACGALAYLTRPEGMLLHIARSSRRSSSCRSTGSRGSTGRGGGGALAFLVLGPALLVGPYIAAKGGIATRPAVARLIGTAPVAPASALEREDRRVPDESIVRTYAKAVAEVAGAVRVIVPWPIAILAILGVGVWRPEAGGARLSIFLGIILGVSTLGLVRLYAAAGYCTERHALLPGVLLILAAANGLSWLMRHVSIDASKLGLGEGRLRPGPAVWGTALGAMLILPMYQQMTPYNSSFASYRQAGAWLAEHPEADGRVLDLTNWSLFFSERRGTDFAGLLGAAERPDTRFVIVRDSQRDGPSCSGEAVRRLLDRRDAVARFPEVATPGRQSILVYDLSRPKSADVSRGPTKTFDSNDTGKRLR